MCTFSPDHGQDQAAQAQKEQTALQKAELDRQHAIQDQIRAATSHFIDNGGEGFAPEEIAAMRSMMMGGVADRYQTAGKSVRSALLARGSGDGSQPVGGDYTKGITGLESGLANESAEGQNSITATNARQRLSNMFNSFNVNNGVAAQTGNDIGIFGNGANNALNQFVAAKSIPGFSDTFAQGLGAGLSKALTSGPSGGCWIAESIYGVDDYRTHIMRFWLNNVWAKQSKIGSLVMKLYLKFGQRIAKSRWLCMKLKPLFDKGVGRAVAYMGGE